MIAEYLPLDRLLSHLADAEQLQRTIGNDDVASLIGEAARRLREIDAAIDADSDLMRQHNRDAYSRTEFAAKLQRKLAALDPHRALLT